MTMSPGRGFAAVTLESILELARLHNGPVVSLYHPTLRATFMKEQNSDRLKTLFFLARKLLGEQGLGAREVEGLLRPVRRLIDDDEFWRRQLDGLAVFAWSGGHRCHRLPFSVKEFATVGKAAHVRPLLPALSIEGHFYMLAISRNRARLLRGTREDVSEVDLAVMGAPRSLADALRFDDFSREMQSHTSGRAVAVLQTHSQATSRSGRHIWHGHGYGAEEVKEQTARYFRLLDKAICKKLAGEGAPLILVGVEYEQSLYRSISGYPHVSPVGVGRNPDRLSEAELHELVWPTAQEFLEKPVVNAKASYERVVGEGRTLADLADIVREAAGGHVETLFVWDEPPVWGSYDPASESVEVRGIRQPGDEDLLDLAVKHTLLHGGNACVVGAEDMPAGAPAVAALRF